MIFSAVQYPLTVQGDSLGSPVVLTVPAGGKHLRIRYLCGSREGVIAPDCVDGRAFWTPPLSLAREYPGDNRIPVTLILEQLRGDTVVASRREELLLSLPESIVPQGVLSYTDAVGYRQIYGAFVQNRSRLTLTAQGTGTFGAEIRDAFLGCGALTGWGKKLTFDLPQWGEIPLQARLWDDRGRTVTENGTIEVLPYSAPAGEITGARQGEALTVQFRGRVTNLAGKNKGTFTVLLKQGEEDWQRFPAAQGWEEAGEVSLPLPEEPWALALEIRDDFETALFPYRRAPFLDMLAEKKALGLGCPARRENAVSLGIPLDMGGRAVENLAQPKNSGDAVSLGYGDSTYWHPVLLWENPAPKEAFPAQTVPASAPFYLIETALEAGEDPVFWEFGKDSGLLRGADGAYRPFKKEASGLHFGTTAKGDGWSVPLRVYALQGGRE